jgi:hypothetical protein
MISNGKVYIINFDRANYYDMEEENIYMFEQDAYDHMRSKTIYVFNMLFKKRIIKTGTRKNR